MAIHPDPQYTAKQFGKVAMAARKKKEREKLKKQIARDKAAMKYQSDKTLDKADKEVAKVMSKPNRKDFTVEKYGSRLEAYNAFKRAERAYKEQNK